MGGFYIQVKNGLLDDDHELRMGPAVWQYMWILDRITKIDEEGIGWVLGGKPVTLDEIAKNRSRDTVSRNLQRLKKEGYIDMTRTPYGLVISVMKAKKEFRRQSAKMSNLSSKRESTNMPNHSAEMPNLSGKNVESNKTETVDRDSKTVTIGASAQEVAEVIDLFRAINPHVNFGNKTERKAAEEMLTEHGLEKVKRAVQFALSQQEKDQYAPRVTTPYQMKTKWASISLYWRQKATTTQKVSAIKL